jgi:hypothetical protein
MAETIDRTVNIDEYADNTLSLPGEKAELNAAETKTVSAHTTKKCL